MPLGTFRELKKVRREFHHRMAAMSSTSATSATSAADIPQGVGAIDATERALMRSLDQLVADAEQRADVFCVS